MEFPELPPFQNGETLDETHLYALSAGALAHDRLLAAAIGRHGLFRPFSLPPELEANRIRLVGRRLRIENLALLSRRGAVFVASELVLDLPASATVEVGLRLHIPKDRAGWREPKNSVDAFVAKEGSTAEAGAETALFCRVGGEGEDGEIHLLPPLAALAGSRAAVDAAESLREALDSYAAALVRHLEEEVPRGSLLRRLGEATRQTEAAAAGGPAGASFWEGLARLVEAARGFHLRLGEARRGGGDAAGRAVLEPEVLERLLAARPAVFPGPAALEELREGPCRLASYGSPAYLQIESLQRLAAVFGSRGPLQTALRHTERLLQPLEPVPADADGERTTLRYLLRGLARGSRLRIYLAEAGEDVFLSFGESEGRLRPLPHPVSRGGAWTYDVEPEESELMRLRTRAGQVSKVVILEGEGR